MKKSELQKGDLLTLRDGHKYMAIQWPGVKDLLLIVYHPERRTLHHIDFSVYNNDLKYDSANKGGSSEGYGISDRDCDVVLVTRDGKVIWERSPDCSDWPVDCKVRVSNRPITDDHIGCPAYFAGLGKYGDVPCVWDMGQTSYTSNGITVHWRYIKRVD